MTGGWLKNSLEKIPVNRVPSFPFTLSPICVVACRYGRHHCVWAVKEVWRKLNVQKLCFFTSHGELV